MEIASIIFIGFIAVMILLFVAMIFSGQEDSKTVKSFENDLRESIIHSQPGWDEIKDIAASRKISKNTIYATLITTKREILAGRDKDLEPHKDLINKYLSSMNMEEPFEGMPNDIKLHLQRIRDNLVGNETLLDPLTSQIIELLSVNEKEKKQMRYYTIMGALVGVAGLAFAIYTYYTSQ